MVEAGSTIGNYEVLRKIGQGAMGAVYLAQHPTIGKRVALKIIHPELSHNEEMVSRFFNEARAVTQIGHPNIVEVHDFGQTPTGESFIVMELLEGIGLGELLRKEGTLPIDRAVRIAIQITDGLRAAHARGIIHRDLKPDNLFLIQRGDDPWFVKILDFGLAKLTGPGAMSHKTRTGAVLGTAHYMAPESAEDARKADHRVDIYALGCILFEMIVGRVPFPGDGFGEVLVRHLREPPPLPTRLRADVSSSLEKIILHALAKKAEFRFSSMEIFGNALRDPESFERGFEDQEPELEPTLSSVLPAPTVQTNLPQSARGPTAKLPADAKTVVAALPAAIDGTAVLANPSGESDLSFVRRRSASVLGYVAAAFGVVAILGVSAGIVHHIWSAPPEKVPVSVIESPDLAASIHRDVVVERPAPVLAAESSLEPPVGHPAKKKAIHRPSHAPTSKPTPKRSPNSNQDLMTPKF